MHLQVSEAREPSDGALRGLKRTTAALAWCLALSATTACSPSAEGPPPTLLLAGTRVVDVETGEVSAPFDLAIRGERIQAIARPGRGPAPDSTTEVIDAAGTYAIPGLHDMHTHLWDRSLLASAYLESGITSVRDMGGALDAWGRWRAAADSIPIPRALVSGMIVDGLQPVVFFYARARDGTEAANQVADLVTRGAEFIKVYSRLSRPAFLGIAEEAGRRGVPFAGHVPYALAASEALAAGMASIEHLTGIALECSANGAERRAEILSTLAPFQRDSVDAERLSEPIGRAYRLGRWAALDDYDPSHCPELLERIGENRTWITPTLVVTGASPERRASRVAPYLERWPEWMRGMMLPGEDAARYETPARLAALRRVFADLDAAGARWLAGSDAPNPGSAPGIGLHHELELLVDFGLTPLAALQAATVHAAEFEGRGMTSGTLVPGKDADIVLLRANPLEDIRNTLAIDRVVLAGRIVATPF